MFVAKFTPTTGEPFTADKNGNMPFIGEVLAGKSKGTLINGTMFQRQGLKEQKLYACENVVEDYEGTPQVRVQILGEISMVEYLELRTVLGQGSLKVSGSTESSEEPVSFEDEIGE